VQQEAASSLPAAGEEFPAGDPTLLAALTLRFRCLGLRLPDASLFVPVFILGLGALWLAQPSSAPTAATAPSTPIVTPATSVPPAVVEPTGVRQRAASGDIDAMERVRQTPRAERSVEDVVALAEGEGQRQLRALNELATRLEKDPKAIEDAGFRNDLLEFVGDGDTATEALRVVASIPDNLGPDLLYAIWTGTKKSNPTTSLAQSLVYTQAVRKHASEALGVAHDLRAVESCPDAKAAVRRAADFGDRRSLHLLGKLLSERGCGPKKADDCYTCLRGSEAVKTAINAVRARKAPKL
jgi:hypothetical protein